MKNTNICAPNKNIHIVKKDITERKKLVLVTENTISSVVGAILESKSVRQ